MTKCDFRWALKGSIVIGSSVLHSWLFMWIWHDWIIHMFFCVAPHSYETWMSWTCGTSPSSTTRQWWRWWGNVATSAPSTSASTGASTTGMSSPLQSVCAYQQHTQWCTAGFLARYTIVTVRLMRQENDHHIWSNSSFIISQILMGVQVVAVNQIKEVRGAVPSHLIIWLMAL